MIKIHPNLINFVKPDAHSKYSPSSADRWWCVGGKGGCAYSIKATENIPDVTSVYAEEGTLAHAVCEAVFREKTIGLPIPVELSFDMLALKDNGDEMMDAANDFYEVCTFWMKNKNIVGDVLWFGQERGVPIFPEKSCYGTGDFIIVGSKASVVIDFKYGKKPVGANSKQLKAYAAGIARHLDSVPPEYKLFAVIHQPRTNDSIKEHSYSIQEMYAALTEIHKSIEICERADNEPVEGSHCFWCNARRTKDMNLRCKLLKEKPLRVAKENFAKFMADSNMAPDTADKKVRRDEAIIKLMALMPAIEDIVKQGKEDFLTRLEIGEHIPGITVINKLGKRSLNAENDADAAKMIKDMFPDVEPLRTITKTSVRTLGDLEKEVGKGNLDPICIRKVTKEVSVLDDKSKSILNSMSQFAINISSTTP